MLTLTSFQGVVQNGVIRLRDVRLPEGTQVVVVAVAETQMVLIAEQLQRLQARPSEDRQHRFDELAERISRQQAEVDIDTISDEELNAIIHEAHAELRGENT